MSEWEIEEKYQKEIGALEILLKPLKESQWEINKQVRDVNDKIEDMKRICKKKKLEKHVGECYQYTMWESGVGHPIYYKIIGIKGHSDLKFRCYELTRISLNITEMPIDFYDNYRWDDYDRYNNSYVKINKTRFAEIMNELLQEGNVVGK